MGRGSPNYTFNYQGLKSFSPPAHFSSVIQSVAFPELNSLTLDELKFLNECPERQEEFLEEFPQIKETNKYIDDLISNIEELAGILKYNFEIVFFIISFSDSNLLKKECLEKLNSTIQLKIEEVTKLAFENERLNGIYQSLSEKYSPKNIKVENMSFLSKY